jgi:Ser/Thr protein kinase RdoA (MazF antagonist)
MLIHNTPYANLTPDAVLDALASVGLFGDGRLLQLNSYENRVFQIHLDDGRVVVAKFYRPQRWSDAQILEEHAFAHELANAEVPVVAPLALSAAHPEGPSFAALPQAHVTGEPATLAHFLPRSPLVDSDAGQIMGALSEAILLKPVEQLTLRFGVTPRAGGRSPELENPQTLEWIGRFLARLHATGARQPFAHRQTLSVETHGRAARDWLIEHQVIPPGQSADWRAIADAALDLVQAAFERIPKLRIIRLHGDCHIGNILWTDTGPTPGPHFVDLDDACNGPAVQDLWMLLSGDPSQRQVQLGSLLDGYEAMYEFDPRELQLIEPLRTLRIIHHSAWLARRWTDPAFPAAFPWFATAAYWGEQVQILREQIEVMQEAAARAAVWY